MKYINKTRLFSIFCLLTLAFTLLFSYSQSIGKNISDSVVRLHIVANSNSQADQNLKFLIRDSILKNTRHIFDKTANPEEALCLAEQNADYIRQIAEREINRHGYDYPVKICTGTFRFPTKVYGNIALPSGKYNAVRIEIGKAQGENWWCVLYPPLCFINGTATVDKNSESKLKSNLKVSEYNLITGKNAPLKVKFKLVEIFRNIF